MELKTICFVVSSPLTVNAFLRHHITVLSRYYHVSVIANMEDEGMHYLRDLPLAEVIPVKIVRSISPKDDVLAIHALTRIFRDKRYDAVHSVTPKAGLVAMTAAKRANIKNRIHIFTGQVWATKKGLFRKLLMAVDRQIVKAATQILVDGKSQRSFLIKNKILKPTNSQVLGPGSISGVNETRFVPSESTKKRVRNVLGFSDEEVVFTFLGRMNSDKGIRELAMAFSRLSQEFSAAKLLLIGYDEENLMKFINEKVSNKSSVQFYGPTAQPEEVLQAADIFCLPSHREGFGTSVLEASLLGLPVICSDAYGLKETIIENVTGLRHPVKNVDALYALMRKLYLNADLRNTMGNEGRQYILNNFRAEHITEEWLRFYADLFENKSQSSK